MTQYEIGDKVQYTLNGSSLRHTGTVKAVVDRLLGVERDAPTYIYDAVEKVKASPLNRLNTHAQRAGLKVGDTVEVLDQEYVAYFGTSHVTLLKDDGSEMPKFGIRSRHGIITKSLWIRLQDVRKVEEGPKAGVKWSDAPVGATHYSLRSEHGSKWHKLDENGDWHFAISDYDKSTRYIKYMDHKVVYPETMVAIPGITVEVNPMLKVLAEVKELQEQSRTKTADVANLQRDIARLNVEAQGKLDEIRAAGFEVKGGELVKTPAVKPWRDWKDGDRVRCITREGKGLASIIVGGTYRVKVDRCGDIGVVDADGDMMIACVRNGCFEWLEAAPEDLSGVHVTQWRRGDTIRNVSDADVGHGDITIGKEYKLLTNGCVEFIDDRGDRRYRSAHNYVLVRRA